MSESTSIRVSPETWRALHERKTDPGTTMDDVVRQLLEDNDG